MKLPKGSLSLLGILLLVSLSTNIDAKRVHRPDKLSLDYIHTLSNSQLSPTSGKSFFGLSKRDPKARHPSTPQCRNVHSSKDKCAFIREYCQDERVGMLDYLEFYYCRLGHTRGFAFVILSSWLAMLFTTIGIAASDFFCVNLSTIASILGMSESMAGVTFLAFGNGSPDVFSTFAAMKIDSGSLAVGELIGAACFITGVVAGSMAIVRPFKVGRKSFMRDVSFFAVAVMFGLFFLADGRIQVWECVVMIVFYLLYVVFVLGWHWMAGRKKLKRQKERHAREHHIAPEEEVLGWRGNQDGVLGGSLHDFRALESGAGKDGEDDDEDEEEQEQREFAELSNNMRRSRPGMDRRLTAATSHTIRPSLVGALEFQAVLNSLEKTKNLQGRQIYLRRYSDEPLSSGTLSEPNTAAADGPFQPRSLLRPAAGPSGRMRAVSVNDAADTSVDVDNFRSYHVPDLILVESDDGQESPEPQFQQNRPPSGLRIDPPQFLAPPFSNGTSPSHSPIRSPTRSPTQSAPVSPLSKALPRVLFSDSDSESISSRAITDSSVQIRSQQSSPPVIRLPRPSMDPVTALSLSGPQWKRFKYWPYNFAPPPQDLYDTFFPTLGGFYEKTFLQKVFALVAVPSVFLLTITLPVVEGRDNTSFNHHIHPHDQSNGHPPGSPTSFISNTTAASPMMPPSNHHKDANKNWNRWLVAVQCISAPIFIVLIVFTDSDTPLLKPILYALLIGLTCLAFLLNLTSPTKPPRLHYLFCFAGFVVAISWISTIAEEVVGILKAFGVIFGISDAILGLTIFAVGNSLGDLVADITVARLGFPVMALSACFGGPMLNILIGIGVGGLYMTLSKGKTVYKIEVSSTLIISAATLLLTLVVLLVWVPFNKWMMDRRIGWTLVAIWASSTIINVAVEIMGIGSKWGGEVAISG
ncbi:Sodium/calcium exchanger protein-domain-containing protein [Trichophaea hybrida]|nr:Sodium/calcium exchanger protein-domain-containing protein [Trichophaea hybrida]